MEDRIPINSESPSLTLDELQHSDELPENPQISIEGDSSVQASHGGTENSALEESKDGDVDMAYAMGEAETGAPGINNDPQTEERNHSNAQVLHLDTKDANPTPPAASFKEIPSTLDEPSLDNVAAAPRDDQVLKSNSPNATKDEDLSEDQKIFSRRSKRPRTSITFTRYSPGEGGGLKRHKAEKDAGGQQHKLLSPVSTESQIIIKSNSTSVEKNNNEVTKKKDLVLKNRSTHHGEKSDNVTPKHDTSKQRWSGPIYSWVDDGIKTENPLPQPVEPVSSDSKCIIIDHTALSIDFGPGLAGEDNGPTSPLAAESPSWKCVKCFNMNVSSKSRCSFCLSWKGGKRDKYPRRSSVDSTASNSGCGPPQPLVIRVGDDVLISRGDAPWKDFNHLVNRSLTLERNSEYASMCYDDPVSRDPGFGVLDPYVARIERMWEEIDDTAESCEGAKKKNGSSVNSSASLPRMMIQTRWYFKREDLEGLSCKLVLDGQTDGVKQRIVSSMTVRDLILSDQVDSNYVTSILGKSNILTLNPSSKGKEKRKLPRGAFVCRYRLDLNTDGSTTGTIRPILDSAAGEQTMQMSTPSNSVQSKDTNRREVEGTSSEDEGSYPPATKVFSSSAYVGPISPTRRVISEGATTMGKIKVGSDYQAFIPDRPGGHIPPLERSPVMVWNPALDEGDAVDNFIVDACSALSKSITQTPFHELNCVESPDFEAEAGKPREISIDSLLAQLHECNYNCRSALDKVTTHPENFVTTWNQDERDQFDSSFRVYRDSLRMISKNLVNSKSCKDVIDYHYRFKLVENFRRFKAKKQEQAREMMETVEYRMLKEKRNLEARHGEHSDEDLSSSDDDGCNAMVGLSSKPLHRNGPINNRIRTWFRTGGQTNGNDGATQLRRNRACTFLIEVKNQVGTDAYMALAKCLRAYNAQCQSSLLDVKASAQDIMKSHPYLFEEFVNEFLPKEIR